MQTMNSKTLNCILSSWGVTVRVSNRNGSRGKFQKEVIIPIPLEWGLCSEQGTCVPLCGCLEFTWQRERRTFLIIFSWDVPVKTQHSAAAYSLTDTGIKKYTLYILKVLYIFVFIFYIAKKNFKNVLKYKVYVHLQQLC